MAKRIRPALLGYQRSWVYDESNIKICEKSRRIGITWATAGEAVTVAGTRKSAGGMDVWYMVNNEDDAKEFISDCTMWSKLFGAACTDVSECLIEDEGPDGSHNILAFEIRFASGNKIRALSSNPRRLRGKQGYAILDEAAHHDDLPAFLKAAVAFTMQGGRVAIISTHNGEDNEFNKLILNERERRKTPGIRRRYSLHRTTLDDALEDGFYEEIVCRRNHRAVNSPEARAAWRERVVDDYGDDAEEELFANPKGSDARILWSSETIEGTRWTGKIPPLSRKIVSMDPSGSDEGEGDACGIISMGVTGNGHIYVTHDDTTDEGPSVWAGVGINRYHANNADTMIAEKNYGGKMVRDLVMLSPRGSTVEYVDIVSRTSKYNRAKPVAAIHKRDSIIHFCGHFPELEKELTTWREGLPSPNRMDAFVQGCAELLWPDDDASGRDSIFFM